MLSEELYAGLVSATKSYFAKAGFSNAVLGLSGGIDSSLTAFVLVDALGKSKVTGLLMPDSSVNHSKDSSDALSLAKKLGVDFKEARIDDMIEAVKKSVKWKQSKLAEMNMRARLRMVLLYDYANSKQALVVGTSNKSELMLGYFTKHGDGATDFIPLQNLFKTEVYDLARFRGLPKGIIEKQPSAGLVQGQTDETELGASYAEIDPVLKEIEKGKGKKELEKMFDAKLVQGLLERIEANRHKRPCQ